jgi:ABC-2 type transport system permease protein/oleandomycin transport system permease protein
MNVATERAEPFSSSSRLFALTDIALITKRNLRRVARTPRFLVLTTLQPVIFLLLYLYVFGGAINTPGSSYIDYLMPAVVIQGILTGATSAVAIAVDLQEGMVDRLRSLPIARSAVLAARTLTDTIRTAFVTMLLVSVGAILGFTFHNTLWWVLAAFAVVLAFSLMISWLLALVGMLVKDAETAQLAGLLLLPLVFTSSAFVPVDSMPDWLQPFANSQPVNVVISAVRTMTQGGDVLPWLWKSAAWIAGMLLVLVPLTLARYRRL